MSSTILLAINAGSSSVKASVFACGRGSEPKILADVEVSGLSSPPAKLKYSCHGERKSDGDEIEGGKVDSQDAAFSHILKTLREDEDLPEIKSTEEISHVAHRVVHGGEYSRPQIINHETMEQIEALTDLAPLHNASALAIVKTCRERLPSAKNIAVFDSQFHQTIPEHVHTIPIDRRIAEKNKLRKYGFHGISYSFILRKTAEFLGKPASETSIIALHLGSGASACVIAKGRSIDTSMSLTPLSGLPGATRSGSVDPSLVFHYAANVGKLSQSSTEELHISKAEEILNKEAGWKALTGTTDFGEIARRDRAERRLAFDLFVDRITQYIGSYYVSLQGQCDALVFAGGIGEKSAALREAVTRRVECLGFHLDREKNEARMEALVQEIGRDGDKKVLVCQTDEQWEMALDCMSMIQPAAADPEHRRAS